MGMKGAFLNLLEDGFAQCDVLFGWDIAEVVLPNLKFSNWNVASPTSS
jgi:glutamine synthetase